MVETIDVDPNLRLTVFDDETAGRKSVDSANVAPTQMLMVNKDIPAFSQVEGSGGAGSVVLSYVDQSFGQAVVPEPGTLLLLGSALAGLTTLGRRRR